MKRALLTGFVLLSAAAQSLAQPAIEHPPHESDVPVALDLPFPVEAQRLGIQVNGIVCSFCAYGLEKALSKLDIVDPSFFENGVLVEIESQRVTVALKPAQTIDFADVYERIKDAGYDPVRFHFRITGELSRTEVGWEVAGQDPAQRFSLAADLARGETSTFQAIVQLRADVAKDAKPENPIAVEVDAIL